MFPIKHFISGKNLEIINLLENGNEHMQINAKKKALKKDTVKPMILQR